MQQTTKYQFNLIDRDDTFSPDALNENTQKLEDALITHEAVVDTKLKEQRLELDEADAALARTVAANKAEAESAAAALSAALGSAGTNCRFETGSYTGKGTYGPGSKNSLSFSFEPVLVFVAPNTGGISSLFLNPAPNTVVIRYGQTLHVNWTSNGLSWYYNASDSSGPIYQLNQSGTKYQYIAFGFDS